MAQAPRPPAAPPRGPAPAAGAMPAVRTLLVSLLLLPAAAFVCPEQGTWGPAPPTDLREGSRCGGACGFHGSCAPGLECRDQPRTQLQMGMGGLKPPGVCAKVHGSDSHPVVGPAMELLNERVNGLYMLVPMHLHRLKERRVLEGTIYDALVEVKPSTCWNDGRRKPLDAACEPLRRSDSQFFGVQVLDSAAGASDRDARSPRYRLLNVASAAQPAEAATQILV
mmetsp:Transcript_116401/g.324353  ORF Transcript_116401/g.324353 Transcript_116401/m.324353 type:complete len:224 (-) Transcript_116401:108-779(-)